jgi:hypothetical protein
MLALLLADAPALPLHEAGKYVAGAYIVFVVLLVVYVAIMATKVARIERELKEVTDYAENAKGGEPETKATQGSPGMPGREAEEMPADSSPQPPTGSDRNLTPSESVGGPSAPARGTSAGGGA